MCPPGMAIFPDQILTSLSQGRLLCALRASIMCPPVMAIFPDQILTSLSQGVHSFVYQLDSMCLLVPQRDLDCYISPSTLPIIKEP